MWLGNWLGEVAKREAKSPVSHRGVHHKPETPSTDQWPVCGLCAQGLNGLLRRARWRKKPSRCASHRERPGDQGQNRHHEVGVGDSKSPNPKGSRSWQDRGGHRGLGSCPAPQDLDGPCCGRKFHGRAREKERASPALSQHRGAPLPALAHQSTFPTENWGLTDCLCECRLNRCAHRPEQRMPLIYLGLCTQHSKHYLKREPGMQQAALTVGRLAPLVWIQEEGQRQCASKPAKSAATRPTEGGDRREIDRTAFSDSTR